MLRIIADGEKILVTGPTGYVGVVKGPSLQVFMVKIDWIPANRSPG